jgi:hypothetical protein
MASSSEHSSANLDHDLLKRKRELNPAGPTTEVQPGSPTSVLRYLQRTAGNRAVNILLQRSSEPGSSSALPFSSVLQREDDAGYDSGLQDVAGEEQLGLPIPDPVTMPLDTGNYGPGDYNPPSNDGTAMAKHDAAASTIQRDDKPASGSGSDGGDSGQPSNSASAQSGATVAGPQQAPYSIQVTRTLRLLPPYSINSLHLDLFGDTQVSVGLDSQGTLSAQVAQNLVTMHFLPNWRVPIDTTLAAIYQQNILPKLQSQPGGQVTAEGKVSKTFSLTLTLTGVRTDSDDGKSRVWGVTGAAGVIKYF